ncbi:MAG: hypothetical protein WDM78_11965 [Puia sp.]
MLLLSECAWCNGRVLYEKDMPFIETVKKDFQRTDISEKLKSLLTIAGSVQKGGKKCDAGTIENAKKRRRNGS